MHAIFAVFFIYFSYLFYLGNLSLLELQTKTRRQRNSSTFCSFKSHNPEILFMSSAASAFVHATRKRSQKVPRAKSGTFWFPWMIPMIQAPFNGSCIALQYETGTTFFHERFQSYTASKIRKFQYNRVVFFHIFSKVYRVCPRTNRKGQEKEYSLCTAKLLGRRHRHPDGRISSL